MNVLFLVIEYLVLATGIFGPIHHISAKYMPWHMKFEPSHSAMLGHFFFILAFIFFTDYSTQQLSSGGDGSSDGGSLSMLDQHLQYSDSAEYLGETGGLGSLHHDRMGEATSSAAGAGNSEFVPPSLFSNAASAGFTSNLGLLLAVTFATILTWSSYIQSVSSNSDLSVSKIFTKATLNLSQMSAVEACQMKTNRCQWQLHNIDPNLGTFWLTYGDWQHHPLPP